jgi:hypothetical protein
LTIFKDFYACSKHIPSLSLQLNTHSQKQRISSMGIRLNFFLFSFVSNLFLLISFLLEQKTFLKHFAEAGFYVFNNFYNIYLYNDYSLFFRLNERVFMKKFESWDIQTLHHIIITVVNYDYTNFIAQQFLPRGLIDNANFISLAFYFMSWIV